MRQLRCHLLPLLLWTAMVGVLYGPLLLGAQALPPSDLTGQFYPFAVFQHRELDAGRLPLWSPGSYGGFPFAADVQSAAFYPPRLLLLWLSPATPLPLRLLEIEGLLHLWLAGAFVYALAVDIIRRREAGLVAAAAFGLSGFLTGYPLLQLAILETIAWLPLALLLLRRAARAGRPLPWLAAAGLALAVGALAGHPQTLLHGAYLAATYYFFLTWRARWHPGWIMGGEGLVALVALGGSALSWYPALRYLPFTVRGEVGYSFVQSGLPATDYLQVLAPGALTQFAPQYVGVSALLLALIAWWHRSSLTRPLLCELRFWATVALLAAVLALGDDGILFELGYRVLPGLGLFRQQERWLSLFSLAMAVLAGIGCARWLDGDLATWRPAMRRAAATMALLLAVSAAMLAVIHRGAPEQWAAIWAVSALLAVLAVGLLALPGRGRWRFGLLLLLLFGDLSIANLRAVPRVAAYHIAVDRADALGWEGSSPVRIDSGGVATVNLGELYGLEDVRGISPLRPAALDAMRSLPGERWRQLLDVGYVLSETPLQELALEQVDVLPAGSLWGQASEAIVYRNTAALGRAWMVYEAITAPDQAAALAMLGDAAFDPAASVLLEVDAAMASTGQDPAPTVQVRRVAANELQIMVESVAPGYLVISEWHAAGWRATVDGASAPLLKANYALQAVALTAGAHQVRLWYAAPDVAWAGALTALALLLGLALARWPRWRVAIWQPQWTKRWQALPAPAPPPRLDWSAAWSRWLPLALLLAGLGLRLFRLGYQELRGDEALSYIMALKSTGEIIPALVRLGDPHSPLHYMLLHVWVGLAGVSEAAMRLPSALLGALLVPAAWGIGRLTGGARRAALLALFVAVSQSLVWIGQDVRSQYTLAALFFALATLLLLRLAERGHWLGWVAYAVCSALSVYGFYYAALGLVGHVVYVLCHRQRKRLLLPFVLSGALALALFAPWLMTAYPSLLASGQLADPGKPRLARFIFNSITYLTAGETWPRAWVRWLAVATLPLAAVGVKALGQRDRPLLAMALTTLLLTGLAAFLTQYVRSTYEQRYLLTAAIAWWLLLVAGAERMLDSAHWLARWLGVIALAALLTLNGVSVWRYYTDPDHSRTAGYRQAADHISARALPGDIFVANAPDPCWDYYLRDVAMPRTMAPARADTDAEAIAATLDELGRLYDRLWFAPQAGSSWDRDGAASHWLEYNTLREDQARYRRVEVAAYRPPRTAGAVLTPIAAALENGIELWGYYLTGDGAPLISETDALPIASGELLEVTLAWRAVQPIAGQCTVFVHLLNERGELVAQHDGVPVLGTRPTHLWQAGEWVLDRHPVQLPDASAGERVQVLVGLYDSDTVMRLRYLDGADALAIATLTLP